MADAREVQLSWLHSMERGQSKHARGHTSTPNCAASSFSRSPVQGQELSAEPISIMTVMFESGP